MIVRCAWCKCLLGFKEPYDDTRTTHGICKPCANELKLEILRTGGSASVKTTALYALKCSMCKIVIGASSSEPSEGVCVCLQCYHKLCNELGKESKR